MALVGYTTYKYMVKPNPSTFIPSNLLFIHRSFLILAIYTEKPFYEEALILTRGYKPITDKLIEPVQPLKIDTSSEFNSLTLLGAQVEKKIVFFRSYQS